MNTDPNIKIIKHIYQLKRGEQDAVEEKNPTPLSGEPIVIFGNDGETRLKIGDGETPVNDCNIIGENAGQFADKTNSDEIFRVGNGTSDENRSNAFVVHEDGRATVQSEPEEDNDVVTKKYVDDNAGETQAEIDELKANKADKDKVIDLLTYRIQTDSNGSYVVITGIKSEVILPRILYIPDMIEGYPVRVIVDSVFDNNSYIYEVYLPYNLYQLGSCFKNCSNLENVVFNNNLKIIGATFQNCTKLTKVDLPYGLTQFTGRTFYGSGLTEIKIPENIELIPSSFAPFCNSLTKVILPKSVKRISDGAFNVDDALTDVYYEGTEEEWNSIDIHPSNVALLNATIHYNQETAVKQDVINVDTKLENFKNRPEGFATSQQGENADTALANTQSLATNKQDKFANVEDQGGDLHLTPSQSAVYFDGRFRYTPDPNADENKDDIVNRDILESYHDTTKQDSIAEVQNNVIIFDDKKVVFPQIPTSDSSPSASGDLTTKSYVDNADTNLQQQIDAIASSSDVVDVVGTYAELQEYDTTHLKDNDIVKVLEDSTHDDAITYYRWDIDTQTWSYVGQSGPYYTKSETDALLQDKASVSSIEQVSEDLYEHEQDFNNPHLVDKTQVGLNNVDNTSDLNKPISTATQTALDGKVNRASAEWLHNEGSDGENLNKIYQCTTTNYGFVQGYFYILKFNSQILDYYWERIDVQPQTDLSDYYNKTETDALLDTKQSLTSSVGKKTPELGEIFNLIEGKFIVTPKTAYPAVGYMSPTSILVSGQSYTFTCKFTTTNNNFDFSTDSTDLRNMFGFWGANATNDANAFWWRMTSHTISYDFETQIVTAKFTASNDSQGTPLGGYLKIVIGDRNANFRNMGTYSFSNITFVDDNAQDVNILADCPIDNQHYVTNGSDTTLALYKGKWVSYDDSANPEIPTLVGGSVCKAGYLSHAEGDGTWATARMSHSEGRGNNFELWMDDDFEYSYNKIYIRENQDWLAQTIRKNAVIAVPIVDDKYNFYYTTDRSKYDNDRGVYYIEVDRNVQGAVFDKPMLVMMGGSTSSWAHTEGNFTNAVDLTATDLEDTEDNKTRQHAEGSRTLATGYVAHAEGEYTQALANHSHAGGEGTIADQVGETAIGRYNDPQSDDLFEIGNGDDDNSRSNAFRVTQTGKVIGGAQTESTDDGLTLTTKTYTDNKLADKADKSMFVTLTQTQYDNLQTIDPNTYYYIIEE